MSLNIKSPEADHLVRALPELTGESKAQAVTEAIRDRCIRIADFPFRYPTTIATRNFGGMLNTKWI